MGSGDRLEPGGGRRGLRSLGASGPLESELGLEETAHGCRRLAESGVSRRTVGARVGGGVWQANGVRQPCAFLVGRRAPVCSFQIRRHSHSMRPDGSRSSALFGTDQREVGCLHPKIRFGLGRLLRWPVGAGGSLRRELRSMRAANTTTSLFGGVLSYGRSAFYFQWGASWRYRACLVMDPS